MASLAPHSSGLTACPHARFSRRAKALLCAILVLFVILIVSISVVQGIAFGAVLASFLMLSLWAGLSISGLAQFVAVVTPGRWRLDIRAAWLMVAILMSGITIPLFQLFKQRILPARGFPLDPYVAQADRLIFGGVDPWQVTHALFGNVRATLFFDAIYGLWLPMMFAFPMVIVMAVHNERVRTHILGAWMASWVLIASVAAWLFGSAGPVYYTRLVGPDAGFAALDAQLAKLGAAAQAQGQPIAAIDFQALLFTGQNTAALLPAGGISAMPSMHVAMATLFAIAAFKVGRAFGWLFTAYAVLIWIGSVHLGWHYALDGVAGAAMMLVVWRVTGKIVARL
jgi:PAP2 superfamily